MNSISISGWHKTNKMSVFDFKQQLAVGDIGEKEFQSYYKHLEPKKSEDRKYDFILVDGQTVELKTDTYDMSATGNFFMELFSDTKKGSIGGPWRAAQDDVRFFVYYFRSNKTFFWFESKLLVSELDKILLVGKYKLKSIRNKGWTAEGYCIPRETLKAILYKEDTFNESSRI